ncbi:uncharacterized protein LOC131949051 [Physella acuta]|uniref:uncharacterized protein LOC131949051 n=1 Tax=Physella acuta TaxID=109671 RepID=UPI0027DC5E49|nr:uncharacterized protein LOC131949051 [Physella acuta]
MEEHNANDSSHSDFDDDSDYFLSIGLVIASQQILIKDSIITCLVLGNLVNIFLLVAIMTSQGLRQRLRNQIIATMCVCFIVEIIIESSVGLLKDGKILDKLQFCRFMDSFLYVHAFLDFISTWYIVTLLIVYIAQLKDFDPRKYLTLKFLKFGHVAVLMAPLLLAVIILTPIIKISTDKYMSEICKELDATDRKYIIVITTIAPIILAILLLFSALVFYCQRFRQGSRLPSDGLVLLSRGTSVDKPVAYILAVSVSVVCFVANIIYIMYFDGTLPLLTMLRLHIADDILQDIFVYLLPLSWLCFDDVRERIKTWRPWRRTRQNVDITVSYNKEENI